MFAGEICFLRKQIKGNPMFLYITHIILFFFFFLHLRVSRTSGEASLESQSELEPAQPSDDASLPSTSQEPTSSSAPGTHTYT